MRSKGKEAACAQDESRAQGTETATAGGAQSQEEFRVGDAVEARCYTHGFRGYWPAEVVEIIPPSKWPLPQAEPEAKFVVKWAQGTLGTWHRANLQRIVRLQARLTRDSFISGSRSTGRHDKACFRHAQASANRLVQHWKRSDRLQSPASHYR